MEKKYKFLLTIIILITIMIIIITTILLSFIKKENKPKEEIKEIIGDQVETDGEVELYENLQQVNIRSSYYVMKNITEKYYEYIKQYQTDTIYDKLEGEIKLTEKDKKANYDILNTTYDQEYIQTNNINNKQIQKNIEIYKQSDGIEINKMYFKDINEEMTIFIAEVNLLKEHKPINKKQIITARVDKKNNTFGIIPESEELQNIEKVAVEKFSDKRIEEKTYNKYIFKNIDDVKYIEDCLEKYKNTILFNKKEAYNLFDEEYREKRFGDYETFSKYIDNNKKDIVGLKFEGYLINNYNDYKEYVCKDKYENLYIFHETATMDYKIMLDTYTLENDVFTEKYKTSDAQYKVMMNIDKVRQMLNARDYKSIFKLLDQNFKEMYFEDNEDKFEEYMKEYFPSYYTVEYQELEKEAGVFIQKTILKDMEEEENELEKVFYIELKQGTDFVMSFNVARH